MKQSATGVPIGQTYVPPPEYQQATVGDFSTGLCDCFSDISLCCLTCCCPCITFGRIAEIVDKGSSSCGVTGALYTMILCFLGCPWIYSCTYRSKLKSQFKMKEKCMADCCTHLFCGPCALCQEYRELQCHGYDVALGWHGNMEKQNNVMMTPPSMDGGMTR